MTELPTPAERRAGTVVAPVARIGLRRDSRWVLRRCARRGHVLAHLADSALAGLTVMVPPASESPPLLRCLRCGGWFDGDDPLVAEVVGSPERPAALSELPQAARGPHGRRFGLLRLLAVERGVRGTLMLIAGVAAFHVADSRGSILSTLERLAVAARPLGEQLGVHITDSWLFAQMEKYLGGTGDPLRLAGLALIAYGVLQIVEATGLWGGWRWAEYLAAVATSAFIPLEIYELVGKPTPLKAGALITNVVVVIYLVYKGRLFGARGGHAAFLRELRDSTLLADLLRSQGRSPAELTSHRVV